MNLAHAPLSWLPLLIGACAAQPQMRNPAPGTIAGVVVDAKGRPARAKVAVVRVSGSHSMPTNDDGCFEFADLRDGTYLVTATTTEGQVAVLADVPTGSRATALPALSPGATLWVELCGRPSARLAVFLGDLRVHDFTLRENKPVPVVVPPGEISVLLYDGDLENERLIALGAGDSQELALALPSARQPRQ